MGLEEGVILTNSDMSLLLHIVQQEMIREKDNIPDGSDLPKLYEKLLDICELEGEDD